MRRDARAHGEPHRAEPEQRLDLVVPRNTDARVSAREIGERSERIVDAEHHVGTGDREIGDSKAVHDVAEVDDPADARSRPRPLGADEATRDEDVVVVEVVVYGASR